jgi:hypothetical protein
MSGKAVLEGTLGFISLPELFQILGGNKSTGTLRLMSPYASNPGIIYFVNGNPVNGGNNQLRGIEAVYSLFGWNEGKFEFIQGKVQVDRAIKNSRMEIVLDALRMLDDGAIQRLGVPPALESVPPGKQREGSAGKESRLPVVKGGMVDYLCIVDEEEYHDGRVVVKEGSHGKWIWVVLEGTVRVSKDTPRGNITLARLGEGSYIGSFTSLLFQDMARSATATAEGDTRLGLLDTQRLAEEFRVLPNIFRTILVSLDRRMKAMTDRAVEGFMKKPPIKLPKGCEVLLPAGSAREEAFIVQDGEAYLVGQVEKETFPLMILKRDDVFGNLPLMDIGHEPRKAFIAAPKGIKVKKIDMREIKEAYDQLTTTMRSMILNVSTSISLTTRLAYTLSKDK